MEKNFYDLELIKILEEHIEDGDFQIISSDIYVDKVNANLPFKGSRVNFEQFDENETVVAFVKNIAMEAGIAPDEKVVYLGDNVSNLTYIFSFKYLEKVIVDILDNPDKIISLGYIKKHQAETYLFLKKKEDNTTVIVEIFGSKNNKLRLKTMYNSIKSDDKIIEDELKSLLNTPDNASRLLAQRVYDFNSSSGTKVQHLLQFTKELSIK